MVQSSEEEFCSPSLRQMPLDGAGRTVNKLLHHQDADVPAKLNGFTPEIILCSANGISNHDNPLQVANGDAIRMSRPVKGGVAGNAVAQQAQQYLEQNISAWMQPKPQGQQILSSTLSSFVTSGPSGSQTPMSQQALQEHNLTQGLSRGHPPAAGSGPSVAGTSCQGLPPSCSSIPHSLSFSGYSHHSLLQGTSFSSPCPSTFGAAQPSAAASFFARAAQRLNLSSKKRRRPSGHPDAEAPPFLTNFAEVLRVSPPPVPPSLLRSAGRKENLGIGKVKVMLRIKGESVELGSPFLSVDGRKKQVTVHDLSAAPTSPARTAGVSAPKMFAFDAVFSPDDSQAEVCSTALPDVIQAVVGGSDGCLFVYGHSNLGKTHTMVGSGESAQELGVMPCAVSWLFRLIHEQRQKTGARFSVRASALELSGRSETLRDLLSEYAVGTEGGGTSPGVYLRDDPIFGAQLMNQSELRAPTAEKAAFLLDAALAARTRDGDDEGRNSHFLFTLHLYQYRVDKGGKGGVAGGRSRLHLFDLGSCDKSSSKPRDGGCLSLSALGNVILALFNGQKHVPYKDSKLTQILKEAMGSLTCRVAMIAHVSSHPGHHSEILGTIQLAARVHRMRKKKIKQYNMPMENPDDKGVCVRPYIRMHAEDGVKAGSSDPDYTSSSEQSCDTVIYVPHLASHREVADFTDNEGPPSSLPVVSRLRSSEGQSSNSLDRKRHNSISKAAGQQDSPRKAADHQNSLTRAGKDSKTQGGSKGSPLLQRHAAPASTQTVEGSSRSAQNSPAHAQKKSSKHRTATAKQDQGTDAAEQSPAKGAKGATKPASDETWIDGPRFAKPKFDSKTLHRLQKEQWVDGPPTNAYGFMDHHKQSMIERWIEDHSRQLQQQGSAKKGGPEQQTEEDSAKKPSTNDPETVAKDRDKRAGLQLAITRNEPQNVQSCSASEASYELLDEEDQADSASNSADVDETDNEENAEATGYDPELHLMRTGRGEVPQQTFGSLEDYVEAVETDEPVPMSDACMQVTEEDIMTEYFMRGSCHRFSQNPLPEVDQSGNVVRNHPLRILSEENLNLASSFADSRSLSVDLDSVSVPDTCRTSAVTWQLLYGSMFQRIKERQLTQQRGNAVGEVPSSSNGEINEKLKRISKLRELIQPLTKVRNQTPVESIFKTCSINRLPSAGSRYTMSEMLCASTDSSMEDLSQADVTSTQSEPADLDYKSHIKPMNGLKLEAFYQKIQKVPPFLEQYAGAKPTQVVSPLSFNRERSYSVSTMETRRSSNLNENENDFKHSPSTSNINSSGTALTNGARPPLSLNLSNSKVWLHRNPSSSSFQKEVLNQNADSLPNRTQRLSGEAKFELKNKSQPDRRESSPKTDLSDSSKRSESKPSTRNNVAVKNIDPTQLTVGQSPSISAKSRLYRNKSKVGDVQTTVHSQQPLSQSSASSLWSKDTSITTSSSPAKSAHRTPPSKTSTKHHLTNGGASGNSSSNNAKSNSKGVPKGLPPARSSPTSSSSTSGVTTGCCTGFGSSSKQRDRQQHSPKVSKQQQQQSGHQKQQSRQDAGRKSGRSKSICRSTSSPSTCVDSGDTAFTDFTDSERYRHATVSLPYHHQKGAVPQVHVYVHHHQRTSSGHGSESSGGSCSLGRQAKELLLKGGGKQQFSGTSSGYESMLRDSEGTPLSSSQSSGNEDSLDRGRRGRRKSPGSSKRSLSAPARSPPSPLGPSQTTISQQPVPTGRRRDRSGRRSDDEVCCTGLLCCRLLDFY